MTRAAFERADEAALAVLERPAMFSGAEVDLAWRLSERLEVEGIYAVVTTEEWRAIERIERVMREDHG
ncbi:MAG: hypothetical protein AB7P52_17650 [Alphaproteobacteria bacterium]